MVGLVEEHASLLQLLQVVRDRWASRRDGGADFFLLAGQQPRRDHDPNVRGFLVIAHGLEHIADVRKAAQDRQPAFFENPGALAPGFKKDGLAARDTNRVVDPLHNHGRGL